MVKADGRKTDTDVVKELARCRAALSALSGLPDERPASEHAERIARRFSWLAKVLGRLDAERC